MLHPDVTGLTAGLIPVGPGRDWAGPSVEARTVIPFTAMGLGLEVGGGGRTREC